jgi:signal transduction histidine kinase
MNAAAGLRSRPLAWMYLVAGLAAVGLYYALPWNSFAQVLVYDAIGASSAVAVALGVRLNRPSLSLPWYLFAAGLFAFTVGDVLFNLYDQVWDREPPVPSVADIFYLAGYPFLTVGLVLLVLCLRSEDRKTGRTDAALLVVAFALCQWIFVMKELVHDSGSAAEKLVSLSYPAMDVVLLTGLVFLALTPLWRTVAYRYLTVSILLLLVADEVYSFAPEKYADASWLDAGWLLSYVFWGVAAIHPSMRALSKPRATRAPRLSKLRLIVLGGALATAPAVLIVERATGHAIDAVAVAIGAATLSALVLWRLAGLVRGLDRLRAAERSARTEAEAAHRLLAKQNERLVEADLLKDEFVALISHDLRTPLTSILGYLELTLEDDLPERQRGYLEIVDRNAQRLLRLVSDLLFVARLEAGQLELHETELDLAAVAQQSVLEAEPRAAAGGITITCETEPVPGVAADRGRIFQLFDNLVSNAIKFTPQGGSVRVSVAPSNGAVRLEVADTGIGIPEGEQRRLFERFFRASTAAERQIQGTGLGLYIARAIVEAHGGEISFESEPGRGTAFRIDIPLEHAGVSA